MSDPDLLHALQGVNDPEIGLSIVELGLVYRAERNSEGIEVALTLTTPSCPVSEMLADEVREALRRTFSDAPALHVELVWDPPWTRPDERDSPPTVALIACESEAERMATATTSADAPATPPRTTNSPCRTLRFVAVAIGALAMAVGLWTGLLRLGVRLPGSVPFADFHGAFMISGFLGTLISLERAVALGATWTYAAPLLSSAGALALLAGMPRLAASAFLCAGAVLLSASVGIAIRHLALFTVVLAIGAACWSGGSMLWLLDYPTPTVAGWWLDFLVLTIAAE